jgi:hypothetical protein
MIELTSKTRKVTVMKWEEVKRLYPNQYVLLTVLKYHIEGNKKYIDDMAVINVIKDSKEATKTLVRCKGDNFVYHTSKENVVMEIVNNPVYRGVL